MLPLTPTNLDKAAERFGNSPIHKPKHLHLRLICLLHGKSIYEQYFPNLVLQYSEFCQ